MKTFERDVTYRVSGPEKSADKGIPVPELAGVTFESLTATTPVMLAGIWPPQ